MATRKVGFTAMFGWIVDSLGLLKRNFVTLMGAGLLTILLGTVLFLPLGWAAYTHPMTPGAPFPMAANLTLFVSLYLLVIVASVLLMPPLLVGWFRLAQRLDRGEQAGAFELLQPYRDGALWIRSIGYSLSWAVIGIVVFALLLGVFWLVYSAQLQTIIAAGGLAKAPPTASFWFGLLIGYLAFIGIASMVQFASTLGFGEIGLAGTSVVEAIGNAVAAVFANLLSLALFMACLIGLALVAGFALAIGMTVLMLVARFVSPAFGTAMSFIFQIVLMLAIYPLMFCGSYFAWKSLLGGAVPPARDPGGSLAA